MSGTKVCSTCKKELPVSMFSRRYKSPDGLQHKCRACASKYAKSRLASDPEYCSGRSRDWRAKNPDKKKAQNAVSHAIRDGRLLRPGKCSKCSSACTPEAHHGDYSDSLGVEWLCVSCHKTAHLQGGE